MRNSLSQQERERDLSLATDRLIPSPSNQTEEKSEKNIQIFGGTHQWVMEGNVTVQHFYGCPSVGEAAPPAYEEEAPNPDEERLIRYFGSEERFRESIRLIGECRSAREVGQLIVSWMQTEAGITKDHIVKKEFLQLILPLAKNVVMGKTINNIRGHINEILTERVRK